MRRLFALTFVAVAVLVASLGAAYASSDSPTASAEDGVVNETAAVERAVKGLDYAFQPSVVTVNSGDNVTLTFSNEDGGVDHNIEVSKLFTSDECNGPCTITVSFVAPAPGEYQIFCITHPDMVGTLKVN